MKRQSGSNLKWKGVSQPQKKGIGTAVKSNMSGAILFIHVILLKLWFVVQQLLNQNISSFITATHKSNSVLRICQLLHQYNK